MLTLAIPDSDSFSVHTDILTIPDISGLLRIADYCGTQIQGIVLPSLP